MFHHHSKLNHVLAQNYNNNEKGKAKIKCHSDKTKDMPKNGIMAFCTFYDNKLHSGVKPSSENLYDLCYKNKSVLTCLKFRIKRAQNQPHLPNEINITLYPNSLFLMPLSTNRIYTHEIRPSLLPFEYLPTRLGYVIRCSDTVAMWDNDDSKVYVKSKSGTYTPLVPASEEDLDNLRKLYYHENTTDSVVEYGNIFFSMNAGDYMKPIY